MFNYINTFKLRICLKMNKDAKTNLLSIALIILAIFYVFFFFLALFRLIKILKEKNKLYISIVFYIGLGISALTRGSTLYLLISEYSNNIELIYLLLVIPDMIYLCVFLVLIWHCLATYTSSHIQLANDRGVFDGLDEPVITKKLQYVLSVVMPIYIILFIIFSILKIFGKINKDELFYINAGFNMGTPLLFISSLLFLKFKFSGRPFRNKEAKLEAKDLFILSSIWSVDRIAIGIFQVILIAFGYLQEFIENYETFTSDYLYPVLCVLYFIVTEFLPDYLVLDYGTMKTFIKKKISVSLTEALNTSGSKDFNLSKSKEGNGNVVIDINSIQIPFQALTLNDPIYSKKRGLGIIEKGTYIGQDIVCRKITFERMSRYEQEGIYDDIKNILKLNNNNICPLVGYCVENESNIYIMTSYYKLGSLYDFLHVKKIKMSYVDKIKIAISIAHGIKYLQDNKIYHCHLSSNNILLEDDMNPLIADYGFDNLKNNASIFNKYTNKNSYSSPEILEDSKSIGQKMESEEDDKIDIYSFGFLLWELITETIPFDVKISELIEYVVTQNLRPEITKQVDKQMTELIRACWDTKPKNRLDIDKVILKLQEKLIKLQNNDLIS